MVGIIVWLTANIITRGFDPYPQMMLDYLGVGLTLLAAMQLPLDPQDQRPRHVVVEAVRADGTVLRTPGEDLTLDLGQQETVAAQLQQELVRSTTGSNGETFRIITVPLGQTGSVLVVGRPLTSTSQVLDVFGLVVLIVGGIGVLWAWLLGGAVARTALRPS
jgi:two-component system sensor histidine kinase MprB